jgi:hypothetical protein
MRYEPTPSKRTRSWVNTPALLFKLGLMDNIHKMPTREPAAIEGTEPDLAKPMAPPPKVTAPRIKDVVASGLVVAA